MTLRGSDSLPAHEPLMEAWEVGGACCRGSLKREEPEVGRAYLYSGSHFTFQIGDIQVLGSQGFRNRAERKSRDTGEGFSVELTHPVTVANLHNRPSASCRSKIAWVGPVSTVQNLRGDDAIPSLKPKAQELESPGVGPESSVNHGSLEQQNTQNEHRF